MHKRRLPEANRDCEARFFSARDGPLGVHRISSALLRMEKIGEIEPELNGLLETGSSYRQALGLRFLGSSG